MEEKKDNEVENMEEIEVSDLPPDDDDMSVTMSETQEYMDSEDMLEEANINDMAACTFTQHSDSVYCASINPRVPGLIITGGGDDKGYLWSYTSDTTTTETGSNEHNWKIQNSIPLLGHKDTVSSVGFNFDGSLAMTGSFDGTIRVWKSDTGELLQVLEGPEDIEWAEWHNKGNAIVAGSNDGTIWMWMAHNGQCIQVFSGHDGGVTAGCFTKDGKTICSGGEDGTVRLWAPKSGVCKHVFDKLNGHESIVTCMSSSDDGDLILTGGGDGMVKLYQISGKRLLQTFHHHIPNSNTTTNGTTTTTSTTNTPLYNIPEESTSTTKTHKKGDNGDSADDDEDDDEDEEEEDIEGGGGDVVTSVECVGFCHSETFKWAASGGLDKTLKIWDIATGQCRSVCIHSASVVSLQWHSTSPIIATAALDNVVRVWDARAGTLLQELSGHQDMITSITMAPILWNQPPNSSNQDTDIIVSVSDDKTVKVFHINVHTMK